MLELLVVITVLAVLLALFAPAVGGAREAARRSGCRDNMKQLALAVLFHADREGRFPAMGNISAVSDARYHTWLTSILPEIDQANLFASYNLDEPADSATNRPLVQTPLTLLACPSDITTVEGAPNLSYVANGGIGWTVPIDCPAVLRNIDGVGTLKPIDLNGDGVVCAIAEANADAEILARTGLFFLENWPAGSGTVRHHTLDSLTDGTTMTLMLSENIRAGYDPEADDDGRLTGWGASEPGSIGLFFSGAVCEDESCTEDRIDYARANSSGSEVARREAINAPLDQPEGLAPWASSLHGPLVNAVFADGHTRTLSETIDGAVYAALYSPQGELIGGPLKQSLVTDF